MAIEQDGRHFCKVTHHENGRVITRRIHELVVQAIDGKTYRVRDKGLPDSISLYCGELEDGKHFADVLCDPRLPRPRLFDFLQKPKSRDLFYMWFGAFVVTTLLFVILGIASAHR